MRGYVINMDADLPRWRSAHRLLGAFGVEPVRVPAVDGRQLAGAPLTMTRGEVGCYLSHVRAWRQIVTDGAPTAIVFEDDIGSDLSPVRMRDALHLARRHASRFDLIYLGKCLSECGALRRIEGDLHEAHGALCTHAYLVSRRGAARLLGRLGAHPPAHPIDLDLYALARYGSLRTAAFHPSLFYQDVSRHGSRLRAAGDAPANTVECNAPHQLLWLRWPAQWAIQHWWAWVVVVLAILLFAVVL